MSRRTALVTRCTQRLVVRACALRLAEDGCNVAICDDSSQQSQLSQLQREIESKGVKCCSYVCDQSNEGEVKNLIRNVVEDLGGVDIVVATFYDATPLVPATGNIVSISAEDFDKALATRPRSLFLILKYTSAQMIRQGRGGRIIGLTTMSALQGTFSPQLSVYCAACFAMRGLMQTAALELGQDNITVNLLAHSVLQEAATQSAFATFDSQAGWEKLGGIQKFVAIRTPLPKKAATSQDIVPVISMLASKECDFMTGQTISVNGGMLMN